MFSVLEKKMDILAQVDANKGTHVALAARLGILPSTWNTIAKKQETPKIVHKLAGSLIKGRA
jgi:hypothetical protein